MSCASLHEQYHYLHLLIRMNYLYMYIKVTVNGQYHCFLFQYLLALHIFLHGMIF